MDAIICIHENSFSNCVSLWTSMTPVRITVLSSHTKMPMPKICCRHFWWWRRQMGTFSALLAICARNSPITGEFPAQRPVTRRFDGFFDLCLNKRSSKYSRGWWFETQLFPLWRHSNVYLLLYHTPFAVFVCDSFLRNLDVCCSSVIAPWDTNGWTGVAGIGIYLNMMVWGQWQSLTLYMPHHHVITLKRNRSTDWQQSGWIAFNYFSAWRVWGMLLCNYLLAWRVWGMLLCNYLSAWRVWGMLLCNYLSPWRVCSYATIKGYSSWFTQLQ